MELLVLLLEENGALVSRRRVMEVVWNGHYVTDHALNNLVSSLHKNPP